RLVDVLADALVDLAGEEVLLLPDDGDDRELVPGEAAVAAPDRVAEVLHALLERGEARRELRLLVAEAREPDEISLTPRLFDERLDAIGRRPALVERALGGFDLLPLGERALDGGVFLGACPACGRSGHHGRGDEPRKERTASQDS